MIAKVDLKTGSVKIFLTSSKIIDLEVESLLASIFSISILFNGTVSLNRNYILFKAILEFMENLRSFSIHPCSWYD